MVLHVVTTHLTEHTDNRENVFNNIDCYLMSAVFMQMFFSFLSLCTMLLNPVPGGVGVGKKTNRRVALQEQGWSVNQQEDGSLGADLESPCLACCSPVGRSRAKWSCPL